MKKLRILIVVVLLAALFLPYFLGFEIKSRYRGILAQFEEAGYQLTSHEYDQGFYHAQARSVFSIPVPKPKGQSSTINLKIVSDIKHGPYTLTDGWIADLAQLTTNFFVDDKPVFPENISSEIYTTLAFSGDGKTSINLPALESPLVLDNNMMMDFSGLQGQVEFNIVKGIVIATASSNGLKFYSSDQAELVIGKIQIDSDSRRGIADLMLGQGRFDVASVKIKDLRQGIDVNLNKLAVSAQTAAEDQAVNMLASYSVDAVHIDGQRYGPAFIEIAFDSVAAEAMARIQQGVTEMQQQQVAPEQQGIAVMGLFMSVMPALLEQNPKLALRRFEIKTPQGMIKANMSLRAENMTIADISVADQFVQKLVGDASLQIPEKLLRQMMTNTMRQQLQLELMRQLENSAADGPDTELPDPQQIELIVEQQVNNQLELMISQGFLERKDTDLVAIASLQAGLLSVNGNMIPIPGIQQ